MLSSVVLNEKSKRTGEEKARARLLWRQGKEASLCFQAVS